MGTLAIGQAGAPNAALLAVSILGGGRPELLTKFVQIRAEQVAEVRSETLP